MSLTEQIARFEKTYERRHGVLLEQVREIIVERDGIGGTGVALVFAILVEPAKTAGECRAIASVIDELIAETPDRVHYVDVANALECCGVVMSAATVTAMAAIVAGVHASRDDAETSPYWSKGFAALSLDDRKTYRKYLNSSLAFEPGATYEFNLQAFITMLSNAIDQRASIDAVIPAYEEVLANYPTFSSAATLNLESLFWIARVVHHRIGGAPLGDVAKLLHDTLWRLAGL